MKLLTKAIEEALSKCPLGSTDGPLLESKVIVKYFNPCGAGTWLVTEGRKLADGDWVLWGMFHIFEWEWGYVLLSELESVKLPFGLGIERDLHAKGTVAELKR